MSLQLSSIALAGLHGHCWNHRYPLRTQFELTIGSLTFNLIRSLATYTSLMLYKTDLAPSTGSWASTNDGKTKEDRKEEKKLAEISHSQFFFSVASTVAPQKADAFLET